MTDVLILGGTGWLSGRVARAWLDAGHPSPASRAAAGPRPTARRSSSPTAPSPARTTRSPTGSGTRSSTSRRSPSTSPRPSMRSPTARAALDLRLVALGVRDERRAGRRRAAALQRARPCRVTSTTTARAKAAAEASVRAGLGDRAAIVRPGLIVGPGDPDRPVRVLGRRGSRSPGTRPCSRPTLEGLARAGDRRRRPRRLHRAIGRERLARDRQRHRRLDAARPSCSQLAREAAGHTGGLVDGRRRLARPPTSVAHWAGPRSLPLWLPARHARLLDPLERAPIAPPAVACARSRETLERTLADERARGLDRERQSGLTRAEELALAREAFAPLPDATLRGCRASPTLDLRMPRPGRYRRPMPSAHPGIRDARSERRSRAPTSGRTPTLGDPAHLLRRAAAGVAVSSPRHPDSKVESMTYSVAVSGASGYAGGEILRILAAHPDVEIRTVTAHSNAGQPLIQHQPHLRSLAHLTLQDTTPEVLAGHDIVFLALPHGQSGQYTDALADTPLVIDAGADHRLDLDRPTGTSSTAATSTTRGRTASPSSPSAARKQRERLVGAHPHRRPRLQRVAPSASASPRASRRASSTRPTSSPCSRSARPARARASRRTSSRARSSAAPNPYAVGGTHRHIPEIRQALAAARPLRIARGPSRIRRAADGIRISFTPVLVPMARGILATSTAPIAARRDGCRHPRRLGGRLRRRDLRAAAARRASSRARPMSSARTPR